MNKLMSALILMALALALATAAAACTEEVIKEVPVEKEVVVEKEVIKEVPVEKIVEREVVKQVPVEKIVEKEVIKEVVVEKEVVQRVVREVVATAIPLRAGLAVEQAKYGGDLKITAQGSIKSLDPGFSPAYVTYAIALYMYEAILAHDDEYVPQPQMVERFDLSTDGLTWTFALRDGLTFHNGASVTADDAIASYPRWSLSSGAGRLLDTYLAPGGLKKLDDRTWTMELTEIWGSVPDALGWTFKTHFIYDDDMSAMPHTEDASEGDITKLIGSGPYKLASWDIGNKVVIERYEEYVPRSEAGTNLAGGRIAYLDTITWLEIPSEETKIAGLKTAEWDMVDGAGLDHYEPMVAHPGINVAQYPFHHSFLGFSHVDYPTDIEKVRQAIEVSLDWTELMSSLGPSDLWFLCPAVYYCNTPWETDIGASEWYNQNDIPRAKALLAEAGYAGEPVTIMNPMDYATIAPLGPVLKARLEDIGMKVEMPGMDWSTMVSKMYNPGWNVFTCWSTYTDPLNDLVATEGGRGYAGGYTFPDMIEARNNFAFADTYQEKMKYAEELQMGYYIHVPRHYGGQFSNIFPHRSYVKNLNVPKYPIYTGVWLEK